MKTRLILFVLVLISGCSKDDLLIDQFTPEYSANPFLTYGYCQDVWGRMISEKSAVIFTGRYGLYTEDDFKTYHYNVFGDYENGIPCFGETKFFDGANAWTLYHAQALSWRLSLGTTTASEAEIIGSPSLRAKNESLAIDNIQPPLVLALNTMFFTAYRDGILKFCSFIDYKADILAVIETKLIPTKVIYSNNRFFLLAKEQNSADSYVFISANGIEWTGANFIADNEISAIKESQDLTVAMGKNDIYVSIHGGDWQKVTLPLQGEIQDIEVIDENTIYAVIGQKEDQSFGWESKLAKSTDKGSSWELMDKNFYGTKISFFNDQHGIAMSKGVLQVTHDGGSTWKLILISDAAM